MTDPREEREGAPPSPAAPRHIPARVLVLNVLSSFAGNFADVLVFLLVIPFILDTLGAEPYGLWSLIWAILSFLGLIDMGLGASVVKYVADARGRDDHAAHRRIVCTLFWTYMVQMTILLALVAGLSFLMDDIFDIPTGLVEKAGLVLFIVGCGFSLAIPLAMFRGILVGHQKQRIANVYKVVSTLVYCGSVFLVLGRWPSLVTLAFLNLLITLVPVVLMMLHALRTIDDISLHPRHFDGGALREVWGFSFYFMLIHVSTLIATRVDTFVITGALNLTAVALYSLAMRVSEQAQIVCLQISRTLSPVVAELHGAGEEERIIQVWFRAARFAVALAVPLLVGAGLLATPLMVHWAGAEFAASASVLQFLLAAALVNVVYSNSHNILSFRGHQRFLAFALLASQVANVTLSIVFVHLWGIDGVAAATLLSTLPFQALVIQGRINRLHALTHRRFLRETVLPSVLPGALMVGGLLAWTWAWPPGNLLEVALAEGVACAIFGGVFWFTGLDGDERARVRGAIRRRTRRARASA